jgi:hypothetical protein
MKILAAVRSRPRAEADSNKGLNPCHYFAGYC